MHRKCLQVELVKAASSAMPWDRGQCERMSNGCCEVRRTRVVNPSERAADAGNFAVGA